MTLQVVTAAAVSSVSLLEAKNHLRVDISDDDSYIVNLVQLATGTVELQARRAFVNRTYDYFLDAWPSSVISLLNPPLVSVTGVYYTDQDGSEVEFDSANYHVDTYREPGRVVLKSTASWPSTQLADINGVRVRFVAGYGATSAVVPEYYRQAILLLVGHYYENREAVTVAQGLTVGELPLGVRNLILVDRGGW